MFVQLFFGFAQQRARVSRVGDQMRCERNVAVVLGTADGESFQ